MTRARFTRGSSLLALAVALAAAPAAAVEPSFTGLGFLPGGSGSTAYDVSAFGSVVVGSGQNIALRAEPFRWEGGVMIGLGYLPGGSEGSALGVSADGSVVVGHSIDGSGYQGEAFRWVNGGMFGLGRPANGLSTAWGVSADGKVVVGSWAESGGATSAFRWTPGGGVTLLPPVGGGTYWAYAVSADGLSVAVTANAATEAKRWSAAHGYVDLGNIPGGGSVGLEEARAVSADGSIVVGNSDVDDAGHVNYPTQEGFVWTATGPTTGVATGISDVGPHGPSHPFHSAANDVSDDGGIVVGCMSVIQYCDTAIRRTAAGSESIDDLLFSFGVDVGSWNLWSATAVSPEGRAIVGWGRNPTGQNEAWRAMLPLPDEYDSVAAGIPAVVALEGGLTVPGGMEVALEVDEPGATVIGQYITAAQELLGLGIPMKDIETLGFRVPLDRVQAWDIDLVGALVDGSDVAITFAYDESLLTVPESDIAIVHVPESGTTLICSPDPTVNTCPGLAVIDTVDDILTVTVPNVPAVAMIAAPIPPVPGPGRIALGALAALVAGLGAESLRRRARGDRNEPKQ